MSAFIPLSVPNFGEKEAARAAEAITSGWVSTSGGKVTEFEASLARYLGVERAAGALRGEQIPEVQTLSSVAVTRDNLFTPEIEKIVFPYDE